MASVAPEFDLPPTSDLTHRNRAERLLTINEVAEWLGVSKAWVYDHVTRKKPFLPCIRLGELTRFKRGEIERFIQEHVRINGST